MAPVAVVGMEIVSLSEAENAIVSSVELPWDSVHEYWRSTVTDASLERETVKLAALPSVTDVWSDVMVAVRLRVLAVSVADQNQVLGMSELWALTSTSYAVLTARPVISAAVSVMVSSVQSLASAMLWLSV